MGRTDIAGQAPAHVRTSGAARTLGRLGLAAFFLLALVTLALGVATAQLTIESAIQLVGFAAFAIVGAILVEEAGHRVGWICLAIGLGGVITAVSQSYVVFAETHPGTVGVPFVALVAAVLGAPATVLVFTYLPLLFPDGHLPSPRWKPVGWLALADIIVFSVAFGLTPTGLFGSHPNPIAVIPAGAPTDLVFDAAAVMTIATGLLCALALIVRYRSADPIVRQQLKWVAAAVSVFAVSLAVAILFPPFDTFAWTLPVLPVAVGIAVLRYRLYDIDVLIGRALVYVPLTALLGGLYAASVALFQRLFVGLTGETSDAAIILTTLILAGAFTPARKALEGAVERRWKPVPAPAATLAASGASTPAGPLGDAALDARIAAVARAVVREELALRQPRPAKQGGSREREQRSGGVPNPLATSAVED